MFLNEVIAQRVFNHLYVYLDSVFLVALLALLIVRKKYLTAIFGVLGGLLYFVVDYGIFHLALGTRTIEGGNMAAVLWWMSMSYGFTNFVWIWLWFSRDEHKFEWTGLIALWWLACPMIAQTFGENSGQILIQRTTGSYHGYMALILLVGYVFAVVFNIIVRDKKKRFPLGWLLITGIAVQFAWEFMLLIGGIRSAEIESVADKLTTLVVNSLLETNLGAVPLYLIYVAVSSKLTENLKIREVGFWDRMAELNAVPLFKRVKPEDISAAVAAAETNGTVDTVAATTDEPLAPPPDEEQNKEG